MKILNYFLVICVGLIFTRCAHNPVSPEARDLTALEKSLVESDNKFGLKLFKEIIKEEKDKNVFISPLSVSMALGMTLNGANGETKAAMEQTLELAGMTTEEINQSYKSLIELLTNLDPKVIFQIANSIWCRQEITFEQEFINLNKTYFDALVQALDFNDPNSVNIINAWVEENTNGKIKEIVDRIDSEIVMFLINAIYFKGTWTFEFDKDLTQDDLFTLPDGSQKTCKMMKLTGDLPYFENELFQAVDLPYGDALFSMTILLPKPQVDIDSLITEINQENWSQWMDSLSEQSVALSFPKFKLEYEIPLKEILKAMGMAIAFEPYQADFTKMYTGPENVYISKVKHKTFVEVNEEGTEAAAVTSVEVGITSIGPSAIPMRVDRPFVFVIRENHSQTILFIGKIVEPIWSENS
ncbi:MAG: serpin family protein [bacterium]